MNFTATTSIEVVFYCQRFCLTASKDVILIVAFQLRKTEYKQRKPPKGQSKTKTKL